VWPGLDAAAVALAGLASLATTPAPHALVSRSDAMTRTFACVALGEAAMDLRGASVSVEVKRLREPCTVEVRRAELRTAGRRSEAIHAMWTLEPTPTGTGMLTLTFKEVERRTSASTLFVELRVEGREARWEVTLSEKG
jgi:hypothetical protein